ncbi:MAG: hypothetical protein JXR37_03470 [Kiritimatiellae bacterium]|nr:hypothetical protein [Kiritimatiellia bacterium]
MRHSPYRPEPKPRWPVTAGALLIAAAVCGPRHAAGRSGIPVQPGIENPLVVTLVPVRECRIVRAHAGTPIDGTVRSLDYRGRVAEYPRRAGDGINYAYNDNDGLHLTLSDRVGFDAVVLHGAARTDMVADAAHIAKPDSGELLWRFKGQAGAQTAVFAKRVRARRISFFNTGEGHISDLGFLRVEKGGLATGTPMPWTPAQREVDLQPPQSKFAPENIRAALDARYKEGHRRVLTLMAGRNAAASIPFEKDRALHFMTPAVKEEQGLAAISLEGQVDSLLRDIPLTITVQDPLDPRLYLLSAEFVLRQAGPFRIGLDMPDQILLKDSRLWVTLRFGEDVVLTGRSRAAPTFWLHAIPVVKALPEALARRKMLLRTFFSPLSEPRPWSRYKRQSREAFFAGSEYAGRCPELFMTIDQCHQLAPEDSTVRQYREWVYAGHLPEVSKVDPPPEPPAGVPAWAWYPRLAWLETRRIAEWWVEERMVPTGEFGGVVGDDTDLYQQFADLPFFERDGVGGALLDGAARMAELADKQNLEGGLNKKATDALHAYEEGINHLALMARWFYGDPVYLERCMVNARNMAKLTIVTDDGRRHFPDELKMGAEDILKPREPARDGGSAPLMWHAALQYADYNRSPAALKTVQEWADAWLNYLKPAQWASRVDVRTGEVKAFDTDSPMKESRGMDTAFTWLYALTGDRRYIAPFRHYFKQNKTNWPARQFLPDIFATGGIDDFEPDPLKKLAAQEPVTALWVNKDVEQLIQRIVGKTRNRSAAVDTLYDAARWPDMYTRAGQYTDRVLMGTLITYPSYAFLGGSCKRNKFNPTHAVSWDGLGTEYGALVTENRPDSLRLAVYSFHKRERTGALRIWALEHGLYKLTVGPDADQDGNPDRVARSELVEVTRADTLPITIPPGVVTLIRLEQTEKRDPIHTRPDLAIAARETRIEPIVDSKETLLCGLLHNIGSADVNNAVVAVLDGKGQTIAEESLGQIPAPRDLFPRHLPFKLRLPRAPRRDWRLVVDPGKAVAEIYEGNNDVDLDRLPARDYSKGWE